MVRFIHRLLVVSVTVLGSVVSTASAAQYMVASDYRGQLRLVDPQSGTISGTLSGGFGAGEIELGPDGLIYASYHEHNRLRTFDLVTGAAARDILLPGSPRDLARGPDGSLYVALTGDVGTARGIYRLDP